MRVCVWGGGGGGRGFEGGGACKFANRSNLAVLEGSFVSDTHDIDFRHSRGFFIKKCH